MGLNFLLIITMDINALVQKLNVIGNIVNALILEIIALIAIVKNAKINHQLILLVIKGQKKWLKK